MFAVVYVLKLCPIVQSSRILLDQPLLTASSCSQLGGVVCLHRAINTF